jgi:flagellar hook-basal body complex protein FliE
MKIESTSSPLTELLKTNKTTQTEDTMFDRMFDTVKEINSTQVQANTKMEDVISGKSEDSHGALIGLEKADIQMQLAVTVRDKLLQGYQQIINMQI